MGFFWAPGYRVNLSYENIIHERKIITIAWKWGGETAVHHLAWDNHQDDAGMLRKFLPVINGADEVVAHYGDGFDVPWFRARCLINRIGPLPVYRTIDTKAWASKYFYFNCNKLDYLARVLGIGCKLRTNYDLWKNIVLSKCAKSLSQMIRYNRMDVILLEKVYDRLAAYSPVRTHAGVLNGQEKWSCPRCAAEKVQKVRRYVTARGTEQQQMKCMGCGGYYNISATARKQYEEARNVKA